MREILFRGKRKDNGEWVYGCFVKSLSSTVHGYIMKSHTAVPATKVILKTVGQFTGMTDKNGVKIFEGDIINNNIDEQYRVKFDTAKGCWGITNNNDIACSLFIMSGCCEVIGNIHDNPELLEVDI